MAAKKHRNLKVYYNRSIVSRDWRTWGHSTREKTVPSIVLKGEWLRNLGFEIGERVDVECSEDKIIISKVG